MGLVEVALRAARGPFVPIGGDVAEVDEVESLPGPGPRFTLAPVGEGAGVEQVTHGVADVGVHAVLDVEHPLLGGGEPVEQPLEGVLCKDVLDLAEPEPVPDGLVECFLGDGRRELLVVPDDDDLSGLSSGDEELREERLASLVDDGEVECLVGEGEVAAGHPDAGHAMDAAAPEDPPRDGDAAVVGVVETAPVLGDRVIVGRGSGVSEDLAVPDVGKGRVGDSLLGPVPDRLCAEVGGLVEEPT